MSSTFAPSHIVWLLRYAVQLQQEASKSRDELAVLRRAEAVRAIAARVESEIQGEERASFTRSELELLSIEEQLLTRRADAIVQRADRSGADLRRGEEWLVLARALREVSLVVQARIPGPPHSPRDRPDNLERR